MSVRAQLIALAIIWFVAVPAAVAALIFLPHA